MGLLSHKQMFFIYQFTTCFGLDRPSSGHFVTAATFIFIGKHQQDATTFQGVLR
jgi:hypothetical protein